MAEIVVWLSMLEEFLIWPYFTWKNSTTINQISYPRQKKRFLQRILIRIETVVRITCYFIFYSHLIWRNPCINSVLVLFYSWHEFRLMMLWHLMVGWYHEWWITLSNSDDVGAFHYKFPNTNESKYSDYSKEVVLPEIVDKIYGMIFKDRSR